MKFSILSWVLKNSFL